MHWVNTASACCVLLLAAQPAYAQPTAKMVRDLTPGAAGTHPADLTPFQDGVLFTTLSTALGESLWRSDGTWRGTRELAHAIAPKEVTAAGPDTVVFAATDGTGDELWKTDGTVAGTTRLSDIRPGPDSSFPRNLTAVGGTVFFTADDGTHGPELWKSDGTTAGTVLVKDVRPGAEYFSFIREFTPVGATLYFTADDGTTRSGVWKSDGTEAGTALVWSGDAAGCVPGDLTAAADGSVYFTCGSGLWKTGGAATSLVRDFAGDEPAQLTAAGATLYFAARGPELWATDGTPDGTRRVKDIAPGPAGSNPTALAAVADTLLFAADDGTHGLALWRSDGTRAGTRRIAGGPRGVPISDVTDVDGTAFLRAGDALWAAFPGSPTPSAARVRRFADPLLGNLTAAGDRLFFSAGDATHGVELWRSG